MLAKTLLLAGIVMALCSTGNAHAQNGREGFSWPAENCTELEYWLVFSGLELCIPKENVERIEHLNLSDPSLSVKFRRNGVVIDLNLLWFQKEDIAAGIHNRLEVTPEDIFRILGGEMCHEERNIIESILYVNENTAVKSYKTTGVAAYALVRPLEEHSSIYVFRPNKRGVIMMAGPLNDSDIRWLLSHVRW